MNMHYTTLILLAISATGLTGAFCQTSVAAQTQGTGQWVLPRTAGGRPDLQGNWTNATITPIQRRRDQGAVYSPE